INVSGDFEERTPRGTRSWSARRAAADGGRNMIHRKIDRSRSAWGGPAAVTLAAMAAGCGGGPRPARGPPHVEIFSWWVSGSETRALSAMLDVFEKDKPGSTVVNAAVMGATDARQALEERLMLGQPPDTFQANGGDDLLRWVVFNGRDDAA